MLWNGPWTVGRERAGSSINFLEWSVECGPERARTRINAVEWSTDCWPERTGSRIMHSDARGHVYKVK